MREPATSSTSCIPPELFENDPSASTSAQHATSSVFSRSDSAPIHNIPMSVIHRPLPSELDEDKVVKFMDEMRNGDTFTPIEVVKVKAVLKADPDGGKHNFYFSMGGCHRYEATKRLGLETIRARIIEVPAAQMRVYLGAGSPF
ncbi:sulfiredoxin, partial [Tremellales sp. Uapishka_1]